MDDLPNDLPAGERLHDGDEDTGARAEDTGARAEDTGARAEDTGARAEDTARAGDHDHIFYGPPSAAVHPPVAPGHFGAPGRFGTPGHLRTPDRLGVPGFVVPPPEGYDRYPPYTGPRISVPDSPPPPPHRDPKKRRVGAQVVAAVVAVIVVAGAAGIIGLVESDSPAAVGAGGNTSTSTNPGTGNGSPSPSSGSSTSANKPNVQVIAAQVDPAVVDVTSTLALRGGEAAGTGMVVTPSGEVLTNNHVIDQATSITAQIDGRGTKYAAKVVGTDPSSDVALIQLEGASGLRTVSFGDSSSVSVGEAVVAIGNALDLPGPPKVTVGTITGTDKPIIAQDSGTNLCESLGGMLQTDAKLEPGNSGGPLVNSSGQVIGINTAAASDSPSGGFSASGSKVGFAIPIEKAIAIVTQMRNGDASTAVHIGPTALLGVQVVGVDGRGNGNSCSSSASGAGSGGLGGIGFEPTAPVSSGALVVTVENGTPAQDAGIQQGDAITSFAGHSVATPQDLTTLVQAQIPGNQVEVGWVDVSGGSHHAMITLAAGPAD